MKNIVITYRAKEDSHSLNAQTPILKSALEQLGHKATIIRFKDIDDKAGVQKRLLDEINKLEAVKVFADDTIGKLIPEEKTRDIDYLFSLAQIEAIGGGGYRWTDNTSYGDHSFEHFKKSFSIIANKLIEVQGTPEKVYVVAQNVYDHGPFMDWGGFIRDITDQKDDEYFELCDIESTLTDQEFDDREEGIKQKYKPLFDKAWAMEKKVRSTPDAAYGIIKDAVVSVGIPEDVVELADWKVEAGLRSDKSMGGQENKTWVITDRHNAGRGYGYTYPTATTILLPTSTQYQKMKHMFNVSDAQFQSSLEKVLAPYL